MDVMTKSVEAQVVPVESEHDAGEFEVVLSTGALDRDGECLHVQEWKTPLPARVHFDGDHGMSIEKTVGSGVPRIEGDKLVVAGSYAKTPYAQMVRQLVNDGHITSTSVTFRNVKTRKDAAPLRELLNGAFVAVPANPEAVVLSSKSAASDDKKPYGDVKYADPKNGKYPIDTEAHCRAAWSYISMDKNARLYSAEELAAIKSRIKAAGKKFGIEFADEDSKSFQDLLMRLSAVEAICKQFGASGDDPSPTHDSMVQAIHDASAHLGAQCVNEIEAQPGAAEGANKAVAVETSGMKNVGSPGRSPEESPAQAATEAAAVAPAEVPAKAADESADRAKQFLTAKGRALRFGLSNAQSF